MLLESLHHQRRFCLHDPFKQPFDLRLDLLDFGLQRLQEQRACLRLIVPEVREYPAGQTDQPWSGLQRLQVRDKLPFHDFALDRLAVVFASALGAVIVGIAGASPLGPAGGKRGAASAMHGTAQDKILIEVGARWHSRLFAHALLHAVPRFHADDRLMLALAQRDAPCRSLDQSRIDRARQKALHFLIANITARRLGKLRLRLQIPLHFSLRLKAPRSKPFIGFAHDLCAASVRHKNLAAPFRLFVAIAERGKEAVKAPLHARLHFLHGLATVLFALQRALGRHHGFDKFAFRRVFKLEVQTCNACAVGRKLLSQHQVEHGVTREPLEIVKDDRVSVLGMLIEIGQQLHHAGAAHEVAAPRHLVVKHGFRFQPMRGGIGPAAMLLRVQAVAFGLADRRNTAVDQRFLALFLGGWLLGHHVAPFS
ncbi:MAG: hypothetical protein QM740_17865 [Acidovorax sp.]